MGWAHSLRQRGWAAAGGQPSICWAGVGSSGEANRVRVTPWGYPALVVWPAADSVCLQNPLAVASGNEVPFVCVSAPLAACDGTTRAVLSPPLAPTNFACLPTTYLPTYLPACCLARTHAAVLCIIMLLIQILALIW